ncbi:hypothetical protein BOX15_Mlig000901g1 [Macrostomum lignano]|uniref:Uncharacterized protein n=2 Tax=Macrostomum lignano TaxID=282301 RepID=A0A267ELN1_9PLAT|nr:hypothetical protein BOX15_Mlig000901g1 [Macrostomum lignano]
MGPKRQSQAGPIITYPTLATVSSAELPAASNGKATANVAANDSDSAAEEAALREFVASLRVRHLDCLLLQIAEAGPQFASLRGQPLFFTLRQPDSQPGQYFYKSDLGHFEPCHRQGAQLARWDRLPLIGSPLTERSRALAAFTVAFYRGPGRAVRTAAAPWFEAAVRLDVDGLTWPAQREDDVTALLVASACACNGPTLALRLKGVTFLAGRGPLACPLTSGVLPNRRRRQPATSYGLAGMRRLLAATFRSVDLEAERLSARRSLAEAERPMAGRRRAEEMRALVRLRRRQVAGQAALLSEWRQRLATLRSETGQLADSLAALSVAAEAAADSVRDNCSSLRVGQLELQQARGQLANQRQAWFEQLAEIFRLGDESIADVPLPMSKRLEGRLSSAEEAKYAAAFGMTAQLTQLIASVMDCPLRHSLICRGSKSLVRDDVILNFAEREFPLYSRGKERSYFLRGVFLLNLNIYGLWCNAGLNTRRPPNLRATAQNLRELLGYLAGQPSDNVLPASENSDRSLCPLGFHIERPLNPAASELQQQQASDSEAAVAVAAAATSVAGSTESAGADCLLPRPGTSPSGLSVQSA